MKNNILSKKKDELEVAVQEEKKRNEENFKIRLNEAIAKERANAESLLQEALGKGKFLFWSRKISNFVIMNKNSIIIKTKQKFNYVNYA